ncbi:WD40 repeat protein [Breznakibacter xylanolyticus]|uniref:WD40 repeat protein n=2 Tax=Breznakibacter xylanolyticus TaxID=990 RepID=A0A2W7N4I4_9BACT|nr:WD40 repeat protein [Breznakibacter xylanolyticus]
MYSTPFMPNFIDIKSITPRLGVGLALFLLLLCHYATAQQEPKEVTKQLAQVNQLISDLQFRKAVEQGKQLLKRQPKNPDVYLAVGLGYYNMYSRPDSAVFFLKKGMDLLNDDELMDETGINLQLSLAKSFQWMLKPERALEIYRKMLLRLTPEASELLNEINREMQTCENARMLIANPINFKITNLGDAVNSPYDDHSPLMTLKGDAILFTSRRPGDGRSLQFDEQYPEKIWLTSAKDTSWQNAKTLQTFFKKNEHESAVSLSPDGKNLFLFRNDPDGKNLYVSSLINGQWATPKRLAYNINSYENETHCSLSADGSTLFFTSDIEGGHGGLDIYYAKKDINGNWGNPRNLGPVVNTPYNEETPMIYLDGKTLYFASEGHNSMGQYDIFYSQMNPDSTWNTPVNMGFPINTPGDDLFFVPTIDRKKAYYATKKFSDNRGGLDIYLIEFEEDFAGKLSVIEGKVNQGETTRVVRLLVTRTDDMKLVGDYRPDPVTGEYTLFLETGYRYQIKEVRQRIEEEVVGEISIPETMAYKPGQQTLSMVKDVPMEPPLLTAQGQLTPSQEKATDKESVLTPSVTTSTTTSTKKVEITESRPIIQPQKPMPVSTADAHGYTIQLLALRKQPLQDYSIFDGLDKQQITEHSCTDGFNRYTFGIFTHKIDALHQRKLIQSKGQFNDAFVRPISEINDMRVKSK